MYLRLSENIDNMDHNNKCVTSIPAVSVLNRAPNKHHRCWNATLHVTERVGLLKFVLKGGFRSRVLIENICTTPVLLAGNYELTLTLRTRSLAAIPQLLC